MANTPKKITSIREAFLVALFVSIAVYFLARSVFLAFAGYGPLEKTLSILFFFSEAFIMFHAVGYFANIYNMNRRELIEKRSEPEAPRVYTKPSVAILIPARHEPKDVLENTVASCLNIDYSEKTIYILDDSSDKKHMEEAEEIAKRYGARIFRRAERHGAKAGVINDCVRTLDDKYVVIFDVDQNPMRNFLNKLVPIMENDPKLALVQTPQFYTNIEENRISFTAQMQQAVFYEYICEGKSTDEAMICCGTNVVIRKEALLDVGGFDETTVTEDFATSFFMHMKGWETLYYNRVNTFGLGPTDLSSYFQQQSRWATGNIAVFRKVLYAFFKKTKELKLIQWFDYFVTGSYYFVGIAYTFLILCPILYIFFGIPSFFMNPVVYVVAFLPYFLISISFFYMTMGRRGYRINEMLKAQALTFLTLPVLTRAAIKALSGTKSTFKITPKTGKGHISYVALWPQLAIWAITLSAVTWGLNRYFYEKSAAILINVLWITYHLLLFSMIFYFNEDDE
jgi:cellulose synthase (UDP-forming)